MSVAVVWPVTDGSKIYSGVCCVLVWECLHLSVWYYESLILRGFYLSFLQKHPLTVLTECIVVEALKELSVYLWIQRGVYQSQTDCATDSIIWPLMLLLMIFLFKMSVSCCSCYCHCCPGNRRWKRRIQYRFSGTQLDFDKNVNVM